MAEFATAALPSVVLVHGGFVDGSGWQDVYEILRKDGYRVSIVQNPTLSLADDVAATKRIVSREKGPVILVGHSYGGVVITEAGNDPKVAGLVYIAAFAPDTGESVAALIKDPPPGAPVPPILPPQDASISRQGKIRRLVCGRRSQGQGGVHGRLTGPLGRRGPQRLNQRTRMEGQTKIATDDKMIPPPAQEFMSKRAGSTVVEVKGSHCVYVSKPGEVVALITAAAKGRGLTTN